MLDRTDLINSLAASMGVAASRPSSVVRDSYYDASTGTLYCKDLNSSSKTAEIALAYFEKLESSCVNMDSESRRLAPIYHCAVVAIREMMSKEG